MIEISNSVRRRLGAVPEPQTHPETDILAAYAENALRRGERERTMEHLAVCASCREVIALATLPVPPSRAEATETKGVPAWSWKGWFAGRSLPALRWAAVAVVAGVTTIVMVEKPWNLKSGPEPLNHAVLIHEGQPASPTAASPETSNTGTPDVAEKAAAPLMAKTEAGAKTPEATDRMTARNVQPPQEVIRRTGVSVLPLGGHRSVIEDKSEPVPPVAVANNSHQDFLNLNRFNSVDAGVEVASQTVALAPSLPSEAANGSPARSFSASRTVPPLSLSSVNSSAFSTAGAMEARPASTAGGDTLKTLRSALKISGRM